MDMLQKLIITVVGITLSAILVILLLYSFETQRDPAISINKQIQSIDRIYKERED